MWRVSEHAVKRYRDHVKPAWSTRRARRDLLAILRAIDPEILDEPPAWALPTKDDGNGWLLLADLAFPIADDGRTLKTCIPRGGVTEKGRERLNRLKGPRRSARKRPLYLRGRRVKEDAWH